MAAGLAASLVSTLALLLPPVLLGIAIDLVFGPANSSAYPWLPVEALPPSREERLLVVSAVIGAAFLLGSGFSRMRGLSLKVFSQKIVHRIRTDVHKKIQALDLASFDALQTGQLLSVITSDVNSIKTFLGNALNTSVRLGITFLGITATLFYLNWQLAALTLLVLPLFALGTSYYVSKISPLFRDLRQRIGVFNSQVENAISGIEVTKTSTAREYEENRVAEASWRIFNQNWSIFNFAYLYRPGLQLVTGASFLVTFLVGGWWVLNGAPWVLTGNLSLGTFVTFILLSQRLRGPLGQVSMVVNQTQTAQASTTRIFAMLDIPVEIENPDMALIPEGLDGEFEFSDVTFGYGEDPVLKDVELDIDAGDTIGIVGPTGAGKTTLVKLVMRFYDPWEGSISVDGYDLTRLDLEAYRSAIGYVGQDPYLFDGTIAENIRYGSFEATKAEIKQAARAAKAHSFIESLPEGYGTPVGERGVKLSGGQRQRISIARTILQNPDVLILDEATSEVDTETELLIHRSLQEFSAEKTSFVIAHRLSTLKDADTIVVLEDGQIVEKGSHSELVKEDGLYANLWKVQTGRIDDLPDKFVEQAIERTGEHPDRLVQETNV